MRGCLGRVDFAVVRVAEVLTRLEVGGSEISGIERVRLNRRGTSSSEVDVLSTQNVGGSGTEGAASDSKSSGLSS